MPWLPDTAFHHFVTWHFGKRKFGTDISSMVYFGRCIFPPCRLAGTCTFCVHGHFDTRTFRHGDILVQGILGTIDIATRDISAAEHFGTWIFWHLANKYGHFGNCATVPKSPTAETSMVAKNPWAEKSLCQKVLYWKVLGDEMSMFRYVRRAETCTCPCDEMSMPKYLLLKCHVPKGWEAPDSI